MAKLSDQVSATTGEPIPVVRIKGAPIYSGAINASQAFEMTATSPAGESTYAGILSLLTAAQTAKARFVRVADRFALAFLPLTGAVAFVAWLVSGDPMRSLAVFVAATPCPLILAAPVAFIAGVARAARRGILVKGGGALEVLARAHTALFDKTGTLTLGGARLLSIETALGESAEEVLRLAASLEQASHHVVAEAIIKAAIERGLTLVTPTEVRETMGAGLRGVVHGKPVSAGSPELVLSRDAAAGWALRAARRAAWRSALRHHRRRRPPNWRAPSC
jgi:P-type E1-E2 ATPase